jgi:hypothetical protein
MSASELLFFAATGVVGFSALVALTRPNPADATRWLGVMFAALAVHSLLLVAPWLASIQLAGGVAIVIAGRSGEHPVERIGSAGSVWSRRLMPAVGFAVVVFVLLGTLARQYVTYGAELDRHPDFASFEVMIALAFEAWVGPLVALGVLGVIAVVIAGLSRAEAGEEGRE